MPQVSVGQVENLEDACDAITRGCEMMSGGIEGLFSRIAEKVAEVNEEEKQSSTMLEAAAQEEMMTTRSLQGAEGQLAAASSELEAARATLYSCQCQGGNEDGAPPDCSSEAWAVDSAESTVSAAEANVEHAAEVHKSAKEHRMHMEQRLELTHQAVSRVAHLEEAVRAESALRLGAVQAFADTGHIRLSQAREALDAYLVADLVAAQFTTWLHWSPSKSTVVSPDDLSSRMSLSPEQQRLFVAYLADRDPAFRATLAGYKEELSKCEGAAERHAVQLKVRRNLAGDVAERMVASALQPVAGNISTQSRTVLDGGRYTKTDLVADDLKAPVILGRGQGMGARKGESIAIEVKCGQASYLYGQKDHMIYQAGGHSATAASMTVCSRDIGDLPTQEEDELRTALRKAGSPLVGMLPRKEEIDKTCWEAVVQANEVTGGMSC